MKAQGSGGKRTYEMPLWKFTDMITVLGTINELREKLTKAGYEAPPVQSIQGWKQRDAVPANWVIPLVQLMLDEGLVTRPDELRLPYDTITAGEMAGYDKMRGAA